MQTEAHRFNVTLGLKSEQFRAAELGIHRITLQRARKAGELGFVRIGDRPMYSHEHIVAWLERNEHQARGKKAA